MKHTDERWNAREAARTEFNRKIDERNDCTDMESAMRKHREAQQIVKDFNKTWN